MSPFNFFDVSPQKYGKFQNGPPFTAGPGANSVQLLRFSGTVKEYLAF